MSDNISESGKDSDDERLDASHLPAPAPLTSIPSIQAPTLDDLRYFIQLWEAAHLLQRGGQWASTVKKKGVKTAERLAAQEFGTVPRSDPYQVLQRIEDYFGRPFFKSKPFGPDPSCNELVSEIAECLRSLDRFVSRGDSSVRLRFGVGHSVSMSVAPRIVGKFREQCPNIDVEIIVDNSVSLRDKYDRLELDLVLTALPATYNAHQAEHKIQLRPALIAPRHHQVARRFRESGSPFLDEAILLPSSDNDMTRYVIHVYEGQQPAIPVPHDLLKGVCARFMRQSSYALINELVARGNDLGITLPHLLTVEQWRHVQVMPFQNLNKAQLSLLSVAKSTNFGERYIDLMDRHSKGEYGPALQCLTRIAIEEMDSLEKLSKNYEQLPEVRYRCFLEMPVKSLHHQRIWMQGRFAQHRGDENAFVGDFELTSALHESQWLPLEKLLKEEAIHFKVEGTIECKTRGVNRNELVVSRGIESDTGEEFCVAFVRRCKGKEYSWPAVGLWHGREYCEGESEIFRPALGYFVITADDEREIGEMDLVKWTTQWKKEAFLPSSFVEVPGSPSVPSPHLKHLGRATAENE